MRRPCRWEVAIVPALSREEEIRLIEHIRVGDETAETARKRLVEAHLALVVSIAKRYANDRVRILDLIQRGNDGLLRAVNALPDSLSDHFSAYATGHIERAIEDTTPQ